MIPRTLLLLALHIQAISPAAPPAPPHQSRSEKIADAIQRVKTGNLGTGVVDASSYIDLIADNNAVEGISALEQLYARSKDTDLKIEIAISLVKLHEKDDAYWNLLESRAASAMASDAPFYLSEAPGATPEGFSAEFVSWASGHDMTPAAAQLVVDENTDKIVALAKTGDSRGIPLLRRGLASRNTMTQSFSAAGLAQAHDSASVPAIIALVKKSTPVRAHSIADSLMFFDDPDAVRLYKLHNPDVDVVEARKFRHNQPFASSALDQ